MSDWRESGRFREALRRFDEANRRDPNREVVDGVEQPREWLYAVRLTEWVVALDPEASETLRLAARCQHLCRWEIPRSDYPDDRAGYLRWRQDLKRFHAKRSAEILASVGYDEATIARVGHLNLKSELGKDPEMQTLEDALCLVFLQYQFRELARKTDEAKVINAVRKSWGKMSGAGRSAALKLRYEEREACLLRRALEEEPGS